jgi:hypothetical protein
MARHPGLLWKRLRHVIVVGILAVFLFVIESIIGCDLDEEPQVYYGPPPADDGQEGNDSLDLDAAVYYGPQPFDTVDAVDDIPDPSDTPQVYYGPQPADPIDELQVLYGPQLVDTIQDIPDPTDTSMAYYGPQPVDWVETEPKDVAMDVAQTWYGPPPDFDTVDPVDTVPDKDLADDVKDAQAQTYYGPPAFYGPQPGE